MKKVSLQLVAAVASFMPFLAHAQNTCEFNLVNHFDKEIQFTIGINPDVLPNLPKNFALAPKGQIQTTVLDNNKEAYISGNAAQHENVFFGVQIKNDVLDFHGYIGKNIAYSYNRSTHTVTFCTPAEYATKKSC